MPAGRPSKFCEKMIAKAAAYCERGATDMELAEALDIHPATLYRWKLEFPLFCEAINAGKEIADERVERSLYQKASGYDVVETQAVKVKVEQHKEDVKVVEVRRHVPADTTAQIFWLKNRRKDSWRDRQEIQHDVSGDLAAALLAARQRTNEKQVVYVGNPE
jgi:transposase-like protein